MDEIFAKRIFGTDLECLFQCSFKHGGGQQFQCGSCSFTGNNQAEFRVHLRMHNHHPANSQAINQSAQNPSIGQIGKGKYF